VVGNVGHNLRILLTIVTTTVMSSEADLYSDLAKALKRHCCRKNLILEK
jgi:hypothetical protein